MFNLSNVTLFGNQGSRQPGNKPKRQSSGSHAAARPVRTHRLRNFFITLFTLIVLLEGFYFYLCYTNNAFISRWRNIYVQTALSTLSHQWLATDLLPAKVVNATIERIDAGRKEQIDVNSSWDLPEQHVEKPNVVETIIDQYKPPAEEDKPDEVETLPYWIRIDREGAETFFDIFGEIDPVTMLDYLDANPEVMDNGWAGINIDKAGLDQNGTTIYTTNGDQVLAVNAVDGILLIRVKGNSWRGILAIMKDPSRVGMCWSAGIGSYGQTVKQIAERNGAILGVSGSGFIDPDGTGNGGTLAGYAMCGGNARGYHAGGGFKRLELRSDDRFYITDAYLPTNDDTTDAVEFTPALIVDGNVIVTEYTDWNGQQPRTVLGQGLNGDIMFLDIEGRGAGGSLGLSTYICANILYDYGCVQSMNLDGGSSSIMYYNGRSITLCSNSSLTDGRYLPNAWLYWPSGSEPN